MGNDKELEGKNRRYNAESKITKTERFKQIFFLFIIVLFEFFTFSFFLHSFLFLTIIHVDKKLKSFDFF